MTQALLVWARKEKINNYCPYRIVISVGCLKSTTRYSNKTQSLPLLFLFFEQVGRVLVFTKEI